MSLKGAVADRAKGPTAPADAPNIVVILLDDIGFADTSTFGGIAETPALDRLAESGLRYNNFHVVGICSPTRAALLTGRNHHRVGFGTVTELSSGFPGYGAQWKKSTASIAQILRDHSYSTAAFGKWHNTPYAEVNPVGPFVRWPTGLGFEYFYGFMAGKDSQWEPSSLYRNTTAIERRATPQQGYHLTTDITDEAIRWLHTQQALGSTKPYFLYFAPGAVHEPHHAPQEWIAKYRGRFDRGWDQLRVEVFARQKQDGIVPANAELTLRPKEIPAWGSLSVNQKRLYAKQMEVYAGFIAHTDHEIGRLLEEVQQRPDGDNTLIVYIVGDNGATAEGGPSGYALPGVSSVSDQSRYLDVLGGPETWSEYAAGWAWLGNTPFQWWKFIPSHFGATRAPLVLSWPARIRAHGELRTQFAHVNDVAATLYDVIGISFPPEGDGARQQPLDGVSLAYTFQPPDVPSQHRTQYFEALGNRAIYHDGWVAAARHGLFGFNASTDGDDFTRDRWELYHVAEDFSEARDLAEVFPEKLNVLRALFDREARDNDVYPLGIRGDSRAIAASIEKTREFVYFPGMPRLQRWVMPSLDTASYRLTARAVIPDSGAQGVILSYGARESGFAWYLKDDRLIYESASLMGRHDVITSEVTVPHGEVDMAFEFTSEHTSSGVGWSRATNTGIGRLFINGKSVGQARFTSTLGAGYSASLGVGQAYGSPVSASFQLPFTFTGTLKEVRVQLQ